MYADIQYEVEDPVATIRLDRPEKLNAFTMPMLGELRHAVEAAVADPAVVGIVITGNGRGFCSGLDSAALSRVAGAGSSARPATDEREVPGLFTTVFTKRGLVAEHGTTWILPRLLGAGRALDLLWSSRLVDAAEAERIGLVEEVVDPAELLPRARRYVTDLAADVSPAALADTKRLVYGHLGIGYPDALRETDEVQYAALDRPDPAEGAAALVERREPKFPRLGSRLP